MLAMNQNQDNQVSFEDILNDTRLTNDQKQQLLAQQKAACDATFWDEHDVTNDAIVGNVKKTPMDREWWTKR